MIVVGKVKVIITILLLLITVINVLPINCLVRLHQKAVISFGLNKTRKYQFCAGV